MVGQTSALVDASQLKLARTSVLLSLWLVLECFTGCAIEGGQEPLEERAGLVERGGGAAGLADKDVDVSCSVGQQRECHVVHELANGTVFCATGAEVCTGGEWSDCLATDRAEALVAEARSGLGGASGGAP